MDYETWILLASVIAQICVALAVLYQAVKTSRQAQAATRQAEEAKIMRLDMIRPRLALVPIEWSRLKKELRSVALVNVGRSAL